MRTPWCSARTSPGAKGGVFKATQGLTDRVRAPTAASTRRSPSRHHRRRHRDGRSRIQGHPPRSSSPTTSTPPSTRSSPRRPASVTAPTGNGACPWSSARPTAAGSTGPCTTRSRSRRSTPTFPGSRWWCRRRRPTSKGLLLTAVEDPDPVMFLEPKKLYRLAKGPYPGGRASGPIRPSGDPSPGRGPDDHRLRGHGPYRVEAASAARGAGDQAPR